MSTDQHITITIETHDMPSNDAVAAGALVELVRLPNATASIPGASASRARTGTAANLRTGGETSGAPRATA